MKFGRQEYRSRIAWALSVLTIFLITAGCTDKRSPKEMKDSLVFGYGDIFKTFDPARQIYAQETAIIQQVLEPLVKFNQQLELKPCLATEWFTPDDCVTWIFKLRHNVTFHDGTPFTADAVKIHFDRIMDPATAATRAKKLAAVEYIEVVDDFTVAFHLKSANCVFAEKMTGTFASIPSPAAIKQYGDGIARHPVGTGPFVFVDWKPDVGIWLKKNPNHWNAQNYFIENLEFRPVPENTTRLILLDQGVIDIASVAFSQVGVARNDPDIDLLTEPVLSVVYVGFNCKKPPFDDKRVRQAANYAVNKEEILKYMFFGVGEVAIGPIPSVLPAFNPDVKRYDYNPAKARELLREAGYPNGVKVTFWTQERGTYWKTTEGTIGYLREAGFDVEVKILDNAVYWDKFDEYLTPDGKEYPTKEGAFDIFVGGWVGGETAHEFLDPLFATGSNSNSSFYSNPKVDKLLDEAQQTVDTTARNDLYKKAQAIIVEDAPWIFAFHGEADFGVRKRIIGYKVNPAGNYFLDGVHALEAPP